MLTLRPYQQECVEAIWRNLDRHVVACLPTGAGKSLAVAELVRRFMEYPDTKILILTHKRELIRQNYNELTGHLPYKAEIGIFCAGLRSKQLRQITIASVQSLINTEDLPPFELIIVDEAHLIPHKQEGQYHELFARLPNARIIGLTATPFRMTTGMLHQGKDRLFEVLCYEAKTGDLIKQGYLSPVVAKAVSEEADLAEVHIRGGEFKPDEMAEAMDKTRITAAAVKDVIARAADRTSILVFCASVKHARNVQDAFSQAGEVSIATITESTPMRERDAIIDRFKARTLRILCNVGVFTTGFNAQNVDCVVLLRATQSPGLYMQCVGRGLRKIEGKKDCLLLDYGGNICRHGPLDLITADNAASGKGAAPTKICPQCASVIFSGFATCPDCGYQFPAPKKDSVRHGIIASELDPISPTIITEYNVKSARYYRHQKMGSPPCLRVEYLIGMYETIKEFVCPEHTGYAQIKAQAWFARRGMRMPKSVDEALRSADRLFVPKQISVKKGKYDEIVSFKFS